MNILSNPVAAFNNSPVCLSVPALFSDTSYTTGADLVNNWWWDLGNGTFSNAKNPTATYGNTGNYLIQLLVKTNKGCLSDTLKKLINIESKPLAKIGYSLPVCENRSILFLDSSVIDFGTIQGWSWSFDNGSTAITQNAAAVLNGGNHLVSLVVKNSKGCSSDPTVKTVFVNPRPGIDFKMNNTCINTNVSFTGVDQPGGNIDRWQWNFDDGTIAWSKDTQHRYASSGDFPVKLFAISSAGCYSDTIQKSITIYATNAFAGNDTIAASNQPLQLKGSGGINYEWFPATGLSNPTIFNPIATNNMDRSYVLRAFTPLGCESFDTIRIKIYDGPEIYVPKAFTPNGDGLNELLRSLPVGLKQFKKFTVYNRLGQIVFETTDSSRGWDGFFKGKAQNPGLFIWAASGTDYLGKEIVKKGTVVLVR